MPAQEPAPSRRPSPDELAACAGRAIPDVIAPGLRVLFCGINPGLYSAWTGHHFARPGNRFWPALHAGGFTPRLFHPSGQEQLLALGYGITNVVPRASARADELTTAEVTAGGAALRRRVGRYRPEWLAVLGVTVYRAAFAAPKAGLGEQPGRLAGARVWVLPNPSGLNAFYFKRMPELFREFRAVVGA